jgi:TRAP-type C4-dicarboxylate transport system permease small subunit
MMGVNLFMFWWGIKLVKVTWYQSISDFPGFSVGASYLPVPLGGLITALFVLERLWTAEFFVEPSENEISTISTE